MLKRVVMPRHRPPKPEGCMCHDWILDVLVDLQAYAGQNNLPGVARKVEEAIVELRREAGLAQEPKVPSRRRPVN